MSRLPYQKYQEEHSEITLRGARAGKYPCFYCGLPSESIDHFIPQAFEKSVFALAEINGILREDINDILMKQKFIPACKECNGLASSGLFLTPNDKKSAVKKSLERRYKKLLDMPDWSEEEISELGYVLQSSVRGALSQRCITRERLAW